MATIHDAIMADETAKALADAGNDAACAARLQAILTEPDPSKVYAVLGLIPGMAFLQTVKALANSQVTGLEVYASVFEGVERWLKADPWLPIGTPMVHAMLRDFEAAFGTATVDALIAYGSRPVSIGADEVSKAWAVYRPGGKVQG